MRIVVVVVRLALTVGLLYLVYGETGPWTVTALALVCASLEAQAYLNSRQAEREKQRERRGATQRIISIVEGLALKMDASPPPESKGPP